MPPERKMTISKVQQEEEHFDISKRRRPGTSNERQAI
jgi:hypothetical protein